VNAISWQPTDENHQYIAGVVEHQDV
jgi:hypothetical protein